MHCNCKVEIRQQGTGRPGTMAPSSSRLNFKFNFENLAVVQRGLIPGYDLCQRSNAADAAKHSD
jgi:hypothetical protein